MKPHPLRFGVRAFSATALLVLAIGNLEAVTPTPVAPAKPGEGLRPFAADEANGSIFELEQLTQIPQATHRVNPQYPFALRRKGVQGQVLVDFVVDESGRVRQVRAVKSAEPEFGEAATAAVAQWTFSPGIKNGQAVRTHLQVPIVFTLKEK